MMGDVNEWRWMMMDGWCWWWTMNDAGWGWRMTMNDDDECQLMCHVWQTSVLIRMWRPVEMYLPCKVCFWNKDAALVLMQLTDDFKQTNDSGSNNAHRSFDTERSRCRQMCSHTGAFPTSNTFIAGLGIDIKYCLDHGDHYYCIGHIWCSMHSEHGENTR